MEKKKPGRPRKTPISSKVMSHGIVPKPINSENSMEMVYDKPDTFKKIFHLFNAMSVRDIRMSMDGKSIKFHTSDHLKKSNIQISINCNKLNHYYCDEPSVIYLNPKNMKKIIKVLNKNYIDISLVLAKKTKKSILTIVFKNELKIDEIREINLIQPTDHVDFKTCFDTSQYPLKFELPCKYFKKMINDIKSFSNVLTISKVGTSNLIFRHRSKDRNVNNVYMVQDESQIKLKSSILPTDIFSSSVQIDYIDPISKSISTNVVHISADTHKDMIFSSVLDNNTIEMFISIKTITI